MLEFRTIDISDKDWINSLLKISDFMGCEYSFANNMAWRRLADSQICRYKDFYINCTFRDNDIQFTYPAGKGDIKEIFNQMREFSESHGKPLIVNGVTDKNLLTLKEIFLDDFTAIKEDGSGDYIYNSTDLIELKGKKYHSKRNHLKKFLLNDFDYKEIDESDFDDCIAFSASLYNDKNGYDSSSSIAEQFAIDTYFKYYHELGLKGAVIKIHGKVVAFTIGEKINSDTFCIHIEKADMTFDGSYPAINNLFAKNNAKDCKYINREEDLGIEGLRKSKRSYYPCFILEKNTLTFK